MSNFTQYPTPSTVSSSIASKISTSISSTTTQILTNNTHINQGIDTRRNIVYISYGQTSNGSMAVVLILAGLLLAGALWLSIYMNAKTAYSMPMNRGDRYSTNRNNLRLDEGPMNFGSNNYGMRDSQIRTRIHTSHSHAPKDSF